MWTNGMVSMFLDINATAANDMQLFTDGSSTISFGAFYQGQWLAEAWPISLLQDIQSSKCLNQTMSMAFMELYPIVVASRVWGSH